MIVDIKKGTFAKGLINYHEKKVERGTGELIQDSTFSRTKEQRIAEFADIRDLNKSVKKDIYTHISVSFSKDDNVTRDQQLEIAEKYMNGMGYANCPRLIYEHWDTKHRHFHIITSTIDLDGKRVNIFRDHYKSQELSREIEKTFGLAVTEYSRQHAEKLQEINARKYKLLKGFEKIINDPNAHEAFSKVITPAELHRTIKDRLSDSQIQQMLKLRDDADDKHFKQLYRIIRQFDAEYKTDKDQLRERLNYIKEISTSRENFFMNVEAQGIYARKIASSSNSHYVIYGIKEKNFYIQEKDLPIALRYDYLFTGKQIGKTFDDMQQKKFLQRMVNRALKNSKTLSEFEKLLVSANITFEYSHNSGGIYGISFKSNQIKDAATFKGSDIGVSWNTISRALEIKPQLQRQTSKPAQIEPTKSLSIPKGFGKALDTSNDDEEQRKKRRNRDQEMDKE